MVKKVFVIDSPSTDNTVAICNEFDNVEVVVHKYPGNQAEQFNWALDNVKIDTEWILRLDADEYLLPELVEELCSRVPSLPIDVAGIEFKRRHIFMGKWVKRGIYPVIMMRMFRRGKGRYDARLMDEHIALSEGNSIVFENDFCDHSLINVSDYCRKHINYAEREACEVLDEEFALSSHIDTSLTLGVQAQEKHKKKGTYNKLPLFWRSFAYFCYRYFVKGAFLDGKEGFLFAFLQGWWYRTLVDAKIYECKKACGDNPEAIKKYIAEHWGIKI
jgi:glycosyltransferase involved in cell wall biosynthesis